MDTTLDKIIRTYQRAFEIFDESGDSEDPKHALETAMKEVGLPEAYFDLLYIGWKHDIDGIDDWICKNDKHYETPKIVCPNCEVETNIYVASIQDQLHHIGCPKCGYAIEPGEPSVDDDLLVVYTTQEEYDRIMTELGVGEANPETEEYDFVCPNCGDSQVDKLGNQRQCNSCHRKIDLDDTLEEDDSYILEDIIYVDPRVWTKIE